MNIAPYEPNNIYCGPSETMLAALPDECIDLTVTSPPYDNLRTYNGYTFDFFAIARQLIRVTKRGGVIVWVVADQTINGSETGTSFKQALYFMAKGMRLHDTMIYEQAGTGAKGSNLAYWQGFEYMFVFSKGKPSTTNLIVDKPNRFKGSVVGSSPKMDALGSRRERGPRTVPEYSKRTNIWRIHPSNGNNTEHPAPFPETLARDHIISWSNPGDLVLDPFTCSGTTAKMAMQNGRHYLGFDISESYCELARKRVHFANPPLLIVG